MYKPEEEVIVTQAIDQSDTINSPYITMLLNLQEANELRVVAPLGDKNDSIDLIVAKLPIIQ